MAGVVADAMGLLLLQEDRSLISLLLSLLSSSAGNLLLTGYPVPFYELSLSRREKSLRGLRDSALPQLRSAYQAFKRLTGSIFLSYPFEEAGVRGQTAKTNPAWLAMGYDPHPAQGRMCAAKAKAAPRVPEPEPELCPCDHKDSDAYTADVCVVGSGAGGGTIAAQLVKAGLSVLVLEKGPYLRTTDFEQASWTESEAFLSAFERGGLCASKDGNIVILAGACAGGGTTVNWSASFRTPDYVRNSWAETMPEVFRDGGVFEAALDKAHELFRVNTEFSHRPSSEPGDIEACGSFFSQRPNQGSQKVTYLDPHEFELNPSCWLRREEMALGTTCPTTMKTRAPRTEDSSM